MTSTIDRIQLQSLGYCLDFQHSQCHLICVEHNPSFGLDIDWPYNIPRLSILIIINSACYYLELCNAITTRKDGPRGYWNDTAMMPIFD